MLEYWMIASLSNEAFTFGTRTAAATRGLKDEIVDRQFSLAGLLARGIDFASAASSVPRHPTSMFK